MSFTFTHGDRLEWRFVFFNGEVSFEPVTVMPDSDGEDNLVAELEELYGSEAEVCGTFTEDGIIKIEHVEREDAE